MKQKLQRLQGGEKLSTLFKKMSMLFAFVLVAGMAWGQTWDNPSTPTSEKYKYRGEIAKKEFSPLMPYNTTTHHQTTLDFPKGEKKTLFEVGTGKGFLSAGTFENGRKIVDYPNFAICASSVNGGIIHYRLTFHYAEGAKYLDIYRHDNDKKDGLAVISLKTPAFFSTDDEIKTINKIEVECFNYDNRHFKLDACYFITAMPDFTYKDIDGNDIGNEYVHPSFLIPSNGTNAYPSNEPAGMSLTSIPSNGYNPDYDDYILEVERCTNFTNDDGSVRWVTEWNGVKNDTLAVSNPTFVWSMNYQAQNMEDVTYTTVNRWGGDALWRLIFQKRVLAAKPVAETAGEPVETSSYKLWNSLNPGGQAVTAKTCANNFYQNTDLVYGNLNTHTQYVDLKTLAGYTNTGTDGATGKWKRILFEDNGGANLPGWKFTVVENNVTKEVTELVGANASGTGRFSYSLEESFKKYSEIRLHALHGTNVNVKALYLGNEFNTDPYAGNWTNINDLSSSYVKGAGNPDSQVSNGSDHYGDGANVNKANYIDISAYDELVVKTNNGTVPAFRFNRWGDTGSDLISFDGNNADFCSHNGDTWTVDLQKIKNQNTGENTGKAYLNCIKANYESSLSLNEVNVVVRQAKILTVADFQLEKHDGVKNTSNISATWNPAYGYVGEYYNPDYYADLSGKEMLELVTTSENPRFVFNRGVADKFVETRYSDSDHKYISKVGNTSPYTYHVNLAAINSDKGMVHLNGVYFEDATEVAPKSMSSLVTKSNTSLASYDLTDTDAQHYYTSVYNGDFTNTIGGAPLSDINYIWFQVRGNEFNYVYCSENEVPAGHKKIYDGNTVIGYYKNIIVDESGKETIAQNVGNILMHVSDMVITKNKVGVRQNHANLVALMTNKTCDLSGNSNNFYGDVNKSNGTYADLTEYSSLRIKGTPKAEYQVVCNGGAGWNAYINGMRYVRLDANGYAELDLRDIPRIQSNEVGEQGNHYVAGHLYLTGIYKTDHSNMPTGPIEYVRVIKDKDDNAAGVRELTKNDFHTWNKTINGTVTRKVANGKYFVDKLGESLSDGGVWLGINGTRGKEEQSYAELTGFKWMKFEGTANGKVRIIANTWDDGKDPYQKAKVDETVTLDANGVGYLDISKYQYFHLNVVCAPFGASAQLNKIKLLPDPRVDYVLEGNGVLSVEAAKAMMDPTACVIDARTRVNNKRVIDLYTEEVYAGNPDVYALGKTQEYIDEMDGNKYTMQWKEEKDAAGNVISRTPIIDPATGDQQKVLNHDYNTWMVNKRYIRMGNPNCLVMMRADINTKDMDIVTYDDVFPTEQYWHGIRLMHHANNLSIPNDYDEGGKVVTAGFFLVDGYPYRVPFDFYIVSGNTACYARYINQQDKPIVNTICLPFPVTLCSDSGDYGKTTFNQATSRTGLNASSTLTNWYKITDLVHNVYKKPIQTSGLLYQDDLREDEYVFLYEQVSSLDAYTPYVFVNGQNEGTHTTSSRDTMTKRAGGRIEVYSGWPDGANSRKPMLKIESLVDEAGVICQNMENSEHKTDINGDRTKDPIIDDYYLYGTNAPVHESHDCWYFNTNGYLVKSDYMTNNAFRAIMKSKTRTHAQGFEDKLAEKQAQVKVVSFDTWINADDETPIETVSDSEELVTVYGVNGILLRPAVKQNAALNGLPRGIYIVNGQKMIKK